MCKDDLIVLANDSHDWDEPHPEKKLFPPHALAGTRGAETVVSEALEKAAAPAMTVSKTRYSAFFGTGLADRLRGAGIGRLYLAGGMHRYMCAPHRRRGVQRGFRLRDTGRLRGVVQPGGARFRDGAFQGRTRL